MFRTSADSILTASASVLTQLHNLLLFLPSHLIDYSIVTDFVLSCL
nr:MAG TPA: hypothetical protein [Bacteriophage sp.]